MKRYKMNEAQKVNTDASKNGIKWRYRGKYNTIDEAIAEAKRWTKVLGVRVTDCETNEIVHEEFWEYK